METNIMIERIRSIGTVRRVFFLVRKQLSFRGQWKARQVG